MTPTPRKWPPGRHVRVVILAALLGCVAWLASRVASAHRPAYADGAHASAATALPLRDIRMSTVTYRTITCAHPQLWHAFDGRRGDELYVQLGLPVLEWLADYRPTFAVLAPGFPAAPGELPFTMPPGLGARVFPTADVKDPESFFEFVTGTRSWILRTETMTLPKSGRGFIVAWEPTRRTGKLWLAVGKAEDFGPWDILANLWPWVRDTRRFHEDFPWHGRAFDQETCAEPSAR